MKEYNYFFVFIITIFLSVSGCTAKTPLIKASACGDSLAVQKLINEGANINEPDSSGYTPLMHAVWSGENETVKALINKGADINAKDSSGHGYTPLLWASSYGLLDIAKLLIDKGADINARGDDKSSPLLLASGSNDELAKLLIDKNADINAQDVSGATALHNTDSLSIIQYLLARNANTSLKNENGWTALRQAIYDKKISKVALIRKNTNWQEGIYPLTSEEKRGRSVYNPPKDMFEVPPEKEKAYQITVHDCNTMIFGNVSMGKLLAELNLWGIPYVARKATIAYHRKSVFQKCMAVMGFECKNNCSKDSKPVDAKEYVVTPKVEEPVTPKKNVKIEKEIETDQNHEGINGLKGIELVNGEVIEGQIISMNPDIVTIRTKDGKLSSYSFVKEVSGFIGTQEE